MTQAMEGCRWCQPSSDPRLLKPLCCPQGWGVPSAAERDGDSVGGRLGHG